ncbi:MAG TPA: hypothetical protein VNM66_03635 [Thermodesulfobacteriota bacterium]|nr:hypothetical protein [Thermodesulfobacteriota bacterium]
MESRAVRWTGRLAQAAAVGGLGVLLVAGLWPAPAAADDDWKGGHRHGRGKRVAVIAAAPAVVAVPPVVVVPPVVLPPVVVVKPKPTWVWVEGHYETRVVTRYVPGPAVAVWVPPRFELRWIDGRLVSVQVSSGHYEYRPGPPVAVTETVRVWVPGRWVPAAPARVVARGANGYGDDSDYDD